MAQTTRRFIIITLLNFEFDHLILYIMKFGTITHLNFEYDELTHILF